MDFDIKIEHDLIPERDSYQEEYEKTLLKQFIKSNQNSTGKNTKSESVPVKDSHPDTPRNDVVFNVRTDQFGRTLEKHFIEQDGNGTKNNETVNEIKSDDTSLYCFDIDKQIANARSYDAVGGAARWLKTQAFKLKKAETQQLTITSNSSLNNGTSVKLFGVSIDDAIT